MKSNNSFISDYAVSEIIGGVILILIAVITFSLIYVYFLYPAPDVDVPIKIEGGVNEEGLIVLQHKGGNPLTSYKIDLRYPDGNIIGSKEIIDDNWEIGDYRFPLEQLDITDVKLVNETVMVQVTLYNINDDESLDRVFKGILSGKITEVSLPPSAEDPMLVSSLRNDTVDEDLRCYTHTINSQINPLTYIYNWMVNGNSITDILIPFDTNTTGENKIKDYSGNGNNGTIFGPIWSAYGILGGGYFFDGNDDYISLPFCFDDTYIDEITVETWIKTSSNSGVIASFDRNNLWELLIDNGLIRWFTNADDGTADTFGITNVADGAWHYVASTYDSSTGECIIYIDGLQDKNESGHNPGKELGSGDTPTGFIGTTNSGDLPATWDLLTYDDFEDGFGNYTDGGRDCILYTACTYAYQGCNAGNIQDNNGFGSSFYHTNGIDVDSPGYTSLIVDFWFRAEDMENGEDFWVRYYDGNQWRTVADYDCGDEFINGQFYHKIVWINESDYTFPVNMKIRFECSASGNYDDVYIDHIYVNATSGGKIIYNYSGMIDEFRIYNRALSAEQIYQNYLCTKDSISDKSVIVSEETILGETWRCIVTPNNGLQEDTGVVSNSLQIISYGGGEQ